MQRKDQQHKKRSQQNSKKNNSGQQNNSNNSQQQRGNRGRAHASGSAAFQPMKPLVGMVISKAGHLKCPPPIVAMRAALARSPICKALRPQALPYKLAACATLSMLANIPPGMLKEHFEKFKPMWILTVHISVPFVAALRKAVVMPPGAIAFTVAGSVIGTQMCRLCPPANMQLMQSPILQMDLFAQWRHLRSAFALQRQIMNMSMMRGTETQYSFVSLSAC